MNEDSHETEMARPVHRPPTGRSKSVDLESAHPKQQRTGKNPSAADYHPGRTHFFFASVFGGGVARLGIPALIALVCSASKPRVSFRIHGWGESVMRLFVSPECPTPRP